MAAASVTSLRATAVRPGATLRSSGHGRWPVRRARGTPRRAGPVAAHVPSDGMVMGPGVRPDGDAQR